MSVVSKISEKFKAISHQEKASPPKCEFCGKRIVNSKWNKEYNYVNVCQEKSKRFFCSRQCKINWILSATNS